MKNLMRNSVKYLSVSIIVLSTWVFGSLIHANGSRDDFCLPTTLAWHSPASPDSCSLMTYVYDDITADDGFTSTDILMGNYFPLADYTSGVIKSVDMCFSSRPGATTA